MSRGVQVGDQAVIRVGEESYPFTISRIDGGFIEAGPHRLTSINNQWQVIGYLIPHSISFQFKVTPAGPSIETLNRYLTDGYIPNSKIILEQIEKGPLENLQWLLDQSLITQEMINQTGFRDYEKKVTLLRSRGFTV